MADNVPEIEIPSPCLNCGGRSVAAYCADCGQAQRDPIRSAGHWAQEYLGAAFTLDSRLARSLLFLLFRPGQLSAEFVAGRRARFMPPLRAYLFISLFYFLVAAVAAQSQVVSVSEAPAVVEWSSEPGTEGWIEARARRVVADPEAFREALSGQIPTALFLSIPLIALILHGLHRATRQYFIEHAVFCLHNHSAFFLIAFAELGAGRLLESAWLDQAFRLLYPAYLWLAMHRFYGHDWIGTSWRFAVVCGVGYVLAVGALLIATILMVMAAAS